MCSYPVILDFADHLSHGLESTVALLIPAEDFLHF